MKALPWPLTQADRAAGWTTISDQPARPPWVMPDDFEPTDAQLRQLLDARGGCRCPHVSPPCGACCEPITQREFEELFFEPSQGTPP